MNTDNAIIMKKKQKTKKDNYNKFQKKNSKYHPAVILSPSQDYIFLTFFLISISHGCDLLIFRMISSQMLDVFKLDSYSYIDNCITH